MREIRVGLLGCGVVGRGFVDLLARAAPLVAQRTGVLPVLSKVAVRDPGKPRDVPRGLLADAAAVVVDPGVDVVVELIGGVEAARTLVLAAIDAGKHVVTANKALLAAHGAEIFGRASRRGVRVAFEASVCGGLPVVRAISQGLVANRIDRVWGVVNGTSNFILSSMEDGATFDGALAAARACGFAEPDPSLDVDGPDARDKLRILVGLAFGLDAAEDAVRTYSIRGVTKDDVAAARASGFVVRQLAQADATADGLWLSVGPALLPERHALAWSRDEFNSLLVHGDAVGETVFFGRGAGPTATASAVLSDVVDVATSPATCHAPPYAPPQIARDRARAFVVRFTARDAAASLSAAVAGLARRGVPVASATADGRAVRVATGTFSETAVRAAAAETAGESFDGAPLVLPVVAATAATKRGREAVTAA